MSQQFPIYLVRLLGRDPPDLTNNNNPTINKAYYKSTNNKNSNRSTNSKPKDDDWIKNLRWELKPGKICPACKKNNHHFYETGCPQMATFAVCKEFYDAAPKEHFHAIKKHYQKYLAELRQKQKDRVKSDKKVLKTLRARYDDEDFASLQETYFECYKQDFPEECEREDNPYLNTDDSEN